MYITPRDSHITYSGRVFHKDATVSFDWPGIQIFLNFSGTSISAILEGYNFFDVLIDDFPPTIVEATHDKQTILLADGLEDKPHKVVLHKRSESNSHLSRFYGFIIEGTPLAPEPLPDRRIEFIGDSHTVGYGNEYPAINCPAEEHDRIYMSSTNTRMAFGPLTAKVLNAQYQINAYSGRGLLRNYNWEMRGKEFLYFYGKTLISQMNRTGSSPDWDFSSWIPHVTVVNIGINDFQKDPPHADPDLFDQTYRSFLNQIRNRYPGVKIICVGSTVTPDRNRLIKRITSIVNAERASGKEDIWYFEYEPENTALDQHPSLEDHRRISKGLSQLVGKITGWEIEMLDGQW